MTNQEAFNIAVKGLAAQDWQPSVLHTKCLYRGPDGRKCAVGHLIPDDQYQAYFDTQEASYDYFLRNIVVNLPALRGVTLDFLRDLQNAHDSASTATEMANNFRRLAFRYDFAMPPELCSPLDNDASGHPI